MKRLGGIALILLVLVATAYVWLRPTDQSVGEAYIAERSATAWSSLAQVRQRVATLHFGDRVNIVQRRGDQVQIRLPGGSTAWLDARVLMDAALWQRGEKLLLDSRAMPVQAAGRTKVLTNVRVEPGRNSARLVQLGRDASVEVFGHAWAEVSPAEESRDSGDDPKAKREDWFLIRGHIPASPAERINGAPDEGSSVDVAGWVIARFIELDLPDTIKDYASSSGMRVLAWFELNRVPEAPGSDQQKPQYLVAGARGGESQNCDFTMLRVYTWGAAKRRYETAYVEGNLCGAMPIRVGKGPSGEPEFKFDQVGGGGDKAERVYRMKQTTVHRVRESGETPSRRRK